MSINLSLEILHESFILLFNITIPKHSQIENLNHSRNDFGSVDSSCDLICVGNGRFFYFRDNGKLDLYHIVKIRYLVIKNNLSVIFIECAEMNWKTSNVDGLWISAHSMKITDK